MMNTEKFLEHLIEVMNVKLVNIKEYGNDPKIVKFLDDYRNAHSLLLATMTETADKYEVIDGKLRTIKDSLSIIQGIDELNIRVLGRIKDTANNTMEILETYMAKIENTKKEISECHSNTNSELQAVKRVRRRDAVLAVCESVGRAFPLGMLGIGAAGELITGASMAKYISLAANPVYILCFASFYATTSQLIKYFSKKKNRKDLTGDLEDILIRLRRLFEEAEKISAPHETTFKELEKYLTSIDNAIYNLSGEGAINVNVMTQIMLEDTNTVQVCFLDLKNKANTIVQVLRKPLRNLDSGYVIN